MWKRKRYDIEESFAMKRLYCTDAISFGKKVKFFSRDFDTCIWFRSMSLSNFS